MKMHYYLRKIKEYLETNLNLTLKENYTLLNLRKEEVDVTGYRVSKRFIRLNKQTLYKYCRLKSRDKRKHSNKRSRSISSLYGWIKRTTKYERVVERILY